MIDDDVSLSGEPDVQELPESPGPVEVDFSGEAEGLYDPEDFDDEGLDDLDDLESDDDGSPYGGTFEGAIDSLVNERVHQQLHQLAAELQQHQAQVYQHQVEDAAELEQIAYLQQTDPAAAEQRRMALAERRVTRNFEAQYGPQLQASGIAMAVHDSRAKYWDEPPEMTPYIENTVIELGLQGQIPNHLVEPIRRLAYGAAALDGQIAYGGAPRTIAAAGAEQMYTGSRHTVPASIRNDAAEFEKHFGKSALQSALREIEFG